jgi:hypothetical protein
LEADEAVIAKMITNEGEERERDHIFRINGKQNTLLFRITNVLGYAKCI